MLRPRRRRTLAAAWIALAWLLGMATIAMASPRCTPTRDDQSALLDGLVTVSPTPGSRDAPPRTQISFLGVPAADIGDVRVVGSRSGNHRGRLRAYSQGDGASFVPSSRFVEGEQVSVKATVTVAGKATPIAEQFTVAHEDGPALAVPPTSYATGKPPATQRFVSRPDLRPPPVSVTASSPATESGDELVTPSGTANQSGPMIIAANGSTIYFHPLPDADTAANLQVQTYDGDPVLTWWQGKIELGHGVGEDIVANDHYVPIAVVKGGNGLHADLHDFQITPSGVALITAYNPILCNLAAAGGASASGVEDAMFQAIDTRTGLVMFQWTSLDHVALADSYSVVKRASRRQPLDYFHINSIQMTSDGSFLVGSRNTWSAFDVDPVTGEVKWQLGGKESSFAIGAGAQTAWQHDAREMPGGEISFFDNGASPQVHPESRGVVLSLDTASKSVTLVTQLLHDPPLVSGSQGDVQALANGDWFVGWGQVADFSEFSPSGQLLFDAHLPVPYRSYRALRFAWTGLPLDPPAIALRAGSGGAATVYASWNGATNVASWQVLAGSSHARLSVVASAPQTGFETAIALPATTPSGKLIAVRALAASGATLGSSRAVRLERSSGAA